MKNIFNLICLALFTMGFLSSCEKDEVKAEFLGGTAPVLTSSTDAVDMSFANADNIGIKLDWTNPDFKFTTGRSSHNVVYNLEIDTLGANFTNPFKQTIVFPGDLGTKIKVSDLNNYMLNQLQLRPGQSHTLEMRVVASVNNATLTKLASNSVQATATPYKIPPKVNPPSTGQLFITGSATPGNWQTAGMPETVPLNQEFTKVSEFVFELTMDVVAGGSYKLIATRGDWTIQYGIAVKNDANAVNGGDFKENGEDVLGPATAGTYKFVYDFQRGKYTVTKI